MGLFDSIMKVANVAKTVVNEVNKLQEDGAGNTSVNTAAKVPAEIGLFEIPMVNLSAGVEKEAITFLGDDEAKMIFKIPEGFEKFRTGAAEVEVSFLYDPDKKDIEWDVDVPYIAIGMSLTSENIVEEYEEKQSISKGEIYRVSKSYIKYKTVSSDKNGVYVTYHFKNEEDSCGYSQIEGYIPNKYKNTEVEEKVLEAINMMVHTYQINKI